MIAGFIVQNCSEESHHLAAVDLPDAVRFNGLANPRLELHDSTSRIGM